MIFDAIIIGAGAAGLMAAYSAGKRNKKILVLEKNDRIGLKILISGGGRCNFTNLKVSFKDYVSDNPHFCKSALSQFTQNDFIKLVEAEKIIFFEKSLGQLFCEKSSRQILDLLLNLIKPFDVTIKTSFEIEEIKKVDDVFIINNNFQSKKLIIACGGLSFPKLGASTLGYEIAKQFGHQITELNPALDGFVFNDDDKKKFSDLSGISLKAVVSCNKNSFDENILFTHNGLSGPSILKASLYWNKNDAVEIDFIPEIKDLKEWLLNLRKESPKKMISNALSQILPERLAKIFGDGIGLKNISDINNTEMKKLNENLKNFRFIPKQTVGFDHAEVTKGGVATNNLNSKTMESKLVNGLYFIGEVVDVTGLLGGYNFQWAWSSGFVAGLNI